MKKDPSLQEIDILKLLSFVLAFLIVCATMTILFIIPSIKEHKELKAINHGTLINLRKIEQTYNANADALNQFKLQNKRTLQAISNDFDEDKFLNKIKEFFDEVKLEKINDEDLEKFTTYRLLVSASMEAPKNFYDFVDFVNAYDNIILIDFPVQMQKTDNKIKLYFNIKVLKVKPNV